MAKDSFLTFLGWAWFGCVWAQNTRIFTQLLGQAIYQTTSNSCGKKNKLLFESVSFLRRTRSKEKLLGTLVRILGCKWQKLTGQLIREGRMLSSLQQQWEGSKARLREAGSQAARRSWAPCREQSGADFIRAHISAVSEAHPRSRIWVLGESIQLLQPWLPAQAQVAARLGVRGSIWSLCFWPGREGSASHKAS